MLTRHHFRRLVSSMSVFYLAAMALQISAAPRSIGGFNVYYGELHNHCAIDDNGHAAGTPAAAYSYARTAANMDFFGLAPHDMYITSAEWNDLAAAANAANTDGSFVTFRGFEWTTSSLGHFAIINSSDYCTSTQSATNTVAEISAWIGARAAAGCVAFFNHPGRQNSTGVEFDHFNGSPVPNIVGMELWNKTDPFSVYYYNDGYFTNDNNKTYYDEAISRGWKLGAAGSGDNHSGTWGTAAPYRTAILANTLTRADLLAALQSRRFFSTLDKNIALSFKINGSEMGSTIPGQNNQTLNVLATDADGELFTDVTVFNRVHAVSGAWTPNTNSVEVSAAINTYDGDYYYVKVRQADGDEAISSPVWISGGQVNYPPACVLTAPTGTEHYTAPAQVCLAADASDNGTVVKVTFYANGTLIGEDAVAPYECIWSNADAGTCSLTAIAVDDAGAATTSAQVILTIASPPGNYIVNKWINTGTDDAEENIATGAVDVSSSTDLELAYDPGLSRNQIVGVRFTGCAVPANAMITRAYIQFTCKERGATTTNISIWGEASINSSTFTTTVGNISDRTATSTSVPWTIPAWDSSGAATANERTPDITPIVQEIVNQSGYTASGALTFFFSGGGTRCAYSFNGSSVRAPLLHLEYTTLPPSNTSPVCVITSPAPDTVYYGTADVQLQATATDQVGTITLVEFFSNGVKVGQDTDAPYGCSVSIAEIGAYALTAAATDDSGATTVSAVVNITVAPPNTPPFCIITAPIDASTVFPPVTIEASASDEDGSIVKVEFFANSSKIGEDTDAPFILVWSEMLSGLYDLTATATDDRNAKTTSPATAVDVVAPNLPPVCTLTTPADNTIFTAPANITMGVAASDKDGTVERVNFYFNGMLAGTDLTAEAGLFTFTVANLSTPGTYPLYAIAVDNSGDVAQSATVSVTINAVPVTVSRRIASGGDDVEEFAGGAILANHSTLELVYASRISGNQSIGLRFTSLGIPRRAIITSAYLKFTADARKTGTTTVTIAGESSDNSAPFTTASRNVSGRAKRAAKVTWTIPSWTAAGQSSAAQQTPDLKSIVQEIVNREGYSTSGAMTFIINGSDTKTARAYERSRSGAPLLVVVYAMP